MSHITNLLALALMLTPPLIIWRAEWLIQKYEKYLKIHWIMWIVFPFVILLISLMREAGWTFLFYYTLFFILYEFIPVIQRESDAFILSIYICFSVAVLWELPIQLTIQLAQIDMFWQAQALSLLQASAIPLFIIKVRKLGFKPNSHHYLGLLLCILIGANLICMIQDNGMTQLNFWLNHLYRIPWIILMLSMIPKALNKPKETSLI